MSVYAVNRPRKKLRSRKDGLSLRNDDSGSFRVLAVLLWAATTVPTTILVISSGARVWGETFPYTPSTQFLRYVLSAAVVVWAVVIVCQRVKRLITRSFGTIFIVVLAVVLPVALGFLYGGGRIGDVATASVSITIVLALFSLKLTIQDLRVVGVLGAVTGALSLGMAWLRPQSAFVLEDGLVLAGPFNNSNYLGIILVLSLPFALLIRRRLLRVLAIIVIVWPILLGGSDSGIITLLILGLCGIFFMFAKSPGIRRLFVAVASAIALLATMILPLVAHDRDAFTGRGAIWKHASDKMLDFLFFGAGREWFADNAWFVGYRMTHAHHLFLDPLIIGGLPYLTVVLGLLFMLMGFGRRVAGTPGQIAPSLYAIALTITGGLVNIFILDANDLRYIATGFVIVTLLSIANDSRSRDTLPENSRLQ